MFKNHRFSLLLVLLLVAGTAGTAWGVEGEAPRELIHLDVWEMIFSLITFVIFFLVLSFLVWPKILHALQAREGKIRHDLEHAENSAKQATATLEEYRAQLAAAHEDVRKIIDQGRDDAQRLKAQLTEQTQAEIDSIRKRAQAEIRGAKEQAINEIVTQTTTMVTDVAAKVLRRQISLNPDDQRRLVEDSLAAASHLGGTANN